MKKWYKSKTYWFNIAVAIIGMLEGSLHLVQSTLGDSYGLVFMAIATIGIMLRNVTTSSIGSADKTKK